MLLNYVVMIQINDECETLGIGLEIEAELKVMALCRQVELVMP